MSEKGRVVGALSAVLVVAGIVGVAYNASHRPDNGPGLSADPNWGPSLAQAKGTRPTSDPKVDALFAPSAVAPKSASRLDPTFPLPAK